MSSSTCNKNIYIFGKLTFSWHPIGQRTLGREVADVCLAVQHSTPLTTIYTLMKQPNTAKWKQLWCDTLSPQYEISNNSSVYFAIIPSMRCIINHHMSYHMLILAQNMHQTHVHSPHHKSNVSPTMIISPYHTIISSIHRSLPWPSHLTPYHRTIAPYHALAPYHRTTAPHHRMHPTSI